MTTGFRSLVHILFIFLICLFLLKDDDDAPSGPCYRDFFDPVEGEEDEKEKSSSEEEDSEGEDEEAFSEEEDADEENDQVKKGVRYAISCFS